MRKSGASIGCSCPGQRPVARSRCSSGRGSVAATASTHSTHVHSGASHGKLISVKPHEQHRDADYHARQRDDPDHSEKDIHIFDPMCTTAGGLALDCRLMSTAAIKIMNSATAAPMPRTPATNTRAGAFPNANAMKNAITATPASMCTLTPAVCVRALTYNMPKNRVKPLNV